MANKFKTVMAVWIRQSKNWRVISIRSLFSKFFSTMTQPYQQIYIRQLGASTLELGMINSFASATGALLSAPLGWLQDRYSLRKIYIIGLTLNILVTILFATAQNWAMIIPAMILSSLVLLRASGAPAIASCQTICDVSLKPEDRSTCKGICDGTFALPRLIAPTIAALIITHYGGISIEGIRPLYWIRVVVESILLIFLIVQLKEIVRPKTKRTRKSNIISDFKEVFRSGIAVERWLIYAVITSFITSMMMPFTPVFSNEIKLADQFTLGWMSAAGLLIGVVLSPFFGRLADTKGRKRIMYMLTPIYWISVLILVFAPVGNSYLLILSGLLAGFRQITGYIVLSPMMVERVPIQYIGRWRGILGLVSGLAAIPAPIIGSLIWDNLGPMYVLLIPLALDALVRLPILSTVPEASDITEGATRS